MSLIELECQFFKLIKHSDLGGIASCIFSLDTDLKLKHIHDILIKSRVNGLELVEV